MAKGKEDFQFGLENNFTADCNDQGSFQVKEFEVTNLNKEKYTIIMYYISMNS